MISIDMGGRVCVVGKVSDNLAKGADVATTDGARRSVLHVAAVGEEDDVVKILLAKGADVAATDGIRWTVQYDGGHEKVVKISLAKEADVAASDVFGGQHCTLQP